MSVLLHGSSRPKGGMKRGSPSIREVCLLGTAREMGVSGDRVLWAGRTYVVETSQERSGDALRYVHLSSNGSD